MLLFFYACGNANERICDDKRGDEAGEKGQNVINFWCEGYMFGVFNYIKKNNLTEADIDDDDVELFRERFITNPQVIKDTNPYFVDEIINLFRSKLSEEEALIAEANMTGEYVVSFNDGSRKRFLTCYTDGSRKRGLIFLGNIRSQIVRFVFPLNTSLETLDIENCFRFPSLIIPANSSLEDLGIVNCPQLTSLTIPANISLETLRVKNCPQLTSLIIHANSSLKTLDIVDCPQLTSITIPKKLGNLLPPRNIFQTYEVKYI